MKKSLLTLALFALVGNMAVAQNPLIKDHFNADPSALVVGDRVYVFPSHDIPAPWDYPRKDWFCMADSENRSPCLHTELPCRMQIS